MSSSGPNPNSQKRPAITTQPVIQLKHTSKLHSNYDESTGSLIEKSNTEQIGKLIGGLKQKENCDMCKKCDVGSFLVNCLNVSKNYQNTVIYVSRARIIFVTVKPLVL